MIPRLKIKFTDGSTAIVRAESVEDALVLLGRKAGELVRGQVVKVKEGEPCAEEQEDNRLRAANL